MILVIALVPYDDIANGVNVLSILAENVGLLFGSFLDVMILITESPFQSAGRWLRVWIVVDAIIVLCAGVFAGEQSSE